MITIVIPAWAFWLTVITSVITAIPKLRESVTDAVKSIRKLFERKAH
jgi:hypothetical protein